MSSLLWNRTVECSSEISTNYEIGVAAIAAVLSLFGIVYTFFGYRSFKAVMFLSGLIFGGTTVFLMCREERIFQQEISLGMAAGIAAGIGILCGLITMLIKYVGLFLQGFFLGLLVAIAGILAMQSVYHPTTAWIPGGILFGVGVIFAVLTLKFQKGCIILSTSVLGGALIVVCIDYFIEQFLLLHYMWEALMAAEEVKICWFSYIVLSVWPVLALGGAILQWKVTGKGYDHTDVIIVRGRRKQVRTHLVRQQQRATRGAREADRPVNQSSGERRQSNNQRRVSNNQRRTDRTEVVAELPQVPQVTEDDSLPPSYFECVELGVGDPVTEHHQVVRTGSGAFVRNHDVRASGRSQNIENPPRGRDLQPNGGQVQGDLGVRVRESQRRRENRNHQNLNDFNQRSNPQPTDARPSRSNSNPQNNLSVTSSDPNRRMSLNPNPSRNLISNNHQRSKSCRKFRVSGNKNLPQGGDRQSLLKVSHGDAVAAHAQRVMAVQNKRLNAQKNSSAGETSNTSGVNRDV